MTWHLLGANYNRTSGTTCYTPLYNWHFSRCFVEGGGSTYQYYSVYKAVVHQMLTAAPSGPSCIICLQFPDIRRVSRMGIEEGNLRQSQRTLAGMALPLSVKDNIHIYAHTYRVQKWQEPLPSVAPVPPHFTDLLSTALTFTAILASRTCKDQRPKNARIYDIDRSSWSIRIVACNPWVSSCCFGWILLLPLGILIQKEPRSNPSSQF
jgi:hypothetical protein